MTVPAFLAAAAASLTKGTSAAAVPGATPPLSGLQPLESQDASPGPAPYQGGTDRRQWA